MFFFPSEVVSSWEDDAIKHKPRVQCLGLFLLSVNCEGAQRLPRIRVSLFPVSWIRRGPVADVIYVLWSFQVFCFNKKKKKVTEMSRSEEWKFSQDQVLVSYQLDEDLSLMNPDWFLLNDIYLIKEMRSVGHDSFSPYFNNIQQTFDLCFKLFFKIFYFCNSFF